MKKLLSILSLAIVCLVSCGKKDEEAMDSKTVLVEVKEDPTVSFNIWFATGSQDDPAGKEGLAYITGALISEGGTKNNTYAQITEKLFPMAAGYSADVDKEMTTFRGRTHKDNLDEYYKLFTEALLHPAFGEEDFKRIKSNTLSYIENQLRYSSDEELGKAVLYDYVFAGTPYGHLTMGTVAGLNSITLDDVKAFYKKHYTKDNFVIGLGGGFDHSLVNKLEKDLASLPAGKASTVETNPPAINGLEMTIVEKENDATAISFGFPISVLRGDDDFFALDLFRSWFGEHRNQSSHLYQVIREERGLNYGDYAYIEAFLNGGSRSMPAPNNARRKQLFEVWLRPVQHVHRHFALRAALRELKDVADNGMTKEEFEKTKQFLYKYALHYAPTVSDRLGYQVDSKFYGVKDDGNYIQHYRDKIKSLTHAQVNAAIKKHIRYDNIKFAVITSGAEKFKSELASNTVSPIRYESEKPPHVLAEDKEIESFTIPLKAEKIRIVKIEDVFAK